MGRKWLIWEKFSEKSLLKKFQKSSAQAVEFSSLAKLFAFFPERTLLDFCEKSLLQSAALDFFFWLKELSNLASK